MAPREWTTTDFYAVLGVPHDSSQETLKRAYRGLARRHHPDVNGGCPKAERRFQEIGAAYAVLSDRTSRSRYDHARRGVRHHAKGPASAARRAETAPPKPTTAAPRHPAGGTGVPITTSPGGTAAFGGWGPLVWAPGLWAMSMWASSVRTAMPAPA